MKQAVDRARNALTRLKQKHPTVNLKILSMGFGNDQSVVINWRVRPDVDEENIVGNLLRSQGFQEVEHQS